MSRISRTKGAGIVLTTEEEIELQRLLRKKYSNYDYNYPYPKPPEWVPRTSIPYWEPNWVVTCSQNEAH